MSINKPIISPHKKEKIELAIKRSITALTTKSALIKSCQSEKSFAPPKPTT